MTLYCGIDLHSNNCVISIIDENDRVCFEKRLPNDIHHILDVLQRFKQDLYACVVESTYNWYWLVDKLVEQGFNVKLAHTTAIPQYSGLKHCNDQSDARHLAHLLRLGILPEGYIYPAEQRGLRDLLRRRLLFVRQRTLYLLSLQSLIARQAGLQMSANQIKTLKGEQIDSLFDPPIRLGAQLTFLALEWQTKAIKLIERDVYKQMGHSVLYDLINSIPGVGKVLASTIVLETGSIERFPGPGNYASYARCVSADRISNGKTKGHGNAKSGNKYLSWAFMEAAHFGAIWSPGIKRYYLKKQQKRHVMVAKKAVANKLARACYFMLKREEPFDEKRAFS